MNVSNTETKPTTGLYGYLYETCSLRVSLLFIMPLLVAYEVGLMTQPGGGTWAGGVIRGTLLTLLGPYGMRIFNIVVLTVLVVLVLWLRRRRSVHVRYYPVLLLECTVYAFFFSSMVFALIDMARLPMTFGQLVNASGGGSGRMSLGAGITQSVGAGVYEEIIFRLLLMTAICMLLQKGLEVRPLRAALVALVVSAVTFATFHYIGPAGDEFRWNSYAYRLGCGVVFGVIYLSRGLAVAAYTHAFYDIFVTLSKATV